MTGRVAAALAMVTLAAAARAQVWSADDYRDRIDRYARAVERGDAHSFRDFWRAPGTVRLPGRKPVTIDNRTEAAALSRPTPNDGDRSRVRLLRDTLHPTAVAPARPDAGALARTILARDEFKRVKREPSAWEKAWQRAWERFVKWLEQLFGDRTLPETPHGWNPAVAVRYTLLFLAIVVGTLAAIGLVRTLRERRGRKKPPAEPTVAADLLALDIEDPLSEAERHARAGAWRDAIRFVYIDTLRKARAAGLLILAAHKTNGDYQAELSESAPDAARSLAPLTERFDRIWYGGEVPDAAQLEAAGEEARATIEWLQERSR